MEEIVNKVANSSLITLDLEEILEHPNNIKAIDIKDFLFQGLLLREKDFRQSMKELDWSIYQDSIVAIHNSNDAIVPKWAYMIIATNLANNCDYYQICDPSNILEQYYICRVSTITFDETNTETNQNARDLVNALNNVGVSENEKKYE